MIKGITERFKDYPDFFITAFSRVNVGNTEKFRKALKKDLTTYMVVKNSLVKRAIEESGKDIDDRGRTRGPEGRERKRRALFSNQPGSGRKIVEKIL